MSNNVGKGKRLGLRSIQYEEGIEHCNTEEIEEKVMTFNKMNFSKVRKSKNYKDEICENINEENVRDKTLSGELNREYCDENNVINFYHC